MATNKTVTVTVLPTLTGDTVASYNVYEGVSGTTLLGTMTPAEAAAGKVFAFTDGIVHSVKTQTVWTTAGASAIRSAGVTLDLSATTQYGLSFVEGSSQYAETIKMDTSDWYIDFEFGTVGWNSSDAIIATGVSVNASAGAIIVQTNSNSGLIFDINDGTRQSVATLTTAIVGTRYRISKTGLVFKMERSENSGSTWTEIGSYTSSAFTLAGVITRYAAYSSALQQATVQLDYIDHNGVVFLPTAQSTGTTITVGGDVLTLFNAPAYVAL